MLYPTIIRRPLRHLALAFGISYLTPAAQAQTIRAVPTFHNIGLHVTLPAVPAPDASIALAIREEGTTGSFREIHPLSRIDSNRFAGSAFQLRSDTAYVLRLTSAAFPGERLVTLKTRSELLPSATNGSYHVAPGGDDAGDGRSFATAFRSLRHALEIVRAGEKIILHEGRYFEGDIEVFPGSSGESEATPTQPILIENAPGERATLDGTDPDFAPQWEVFDATHGVYHTPTDRQPYLAYLNGGHFYHFGNLPDLVTNRWDQTSGYYADGTNLYVRLADGGPIATNQITIPRFTLGVSLSVSYYQIRGLEFCYYGYAGAPIALSLENASSNLVENCNFHHTGTGVAIRQDSIHNTIQRCSFNEWPVDTFRWDAIKQGEPYGSEPYQTGGVVVSGDHTVYHGNVIRSNRFEHLFDGVHLFSDDAAAPTEDLDFHDNVILDCGDDGIETDGVGSNCRIYNNVISNYLTGISVAPAALGPTYILRNTLLHTRSVPSVEGEPDGRFHGYPIKLNHQTREEPWTSWVYLYHNTCTTDEPGIDGYVFNYYWWYWTNIVSRNNIYAGTRNALVNVNENCPIDFDYDCLFTTDSARLVEWYPTNYVNLAAFTQGTGHERHGLATDPLFLGSGDVRLASGSPLIDRGVVLPGINDGYLGAAPDIGAIESTSAPRAVAITLAGGQVTIRWQVTQGISWQLQSTEGLTPAGWSDVGSPVTAASSTIEFHSPAASALGFYRIRMTGP